MNHSETKICQNCKNSFIIDAQDFRFYEKIDVPAPSFCPECRVIRRMIWRNERSLYKRKCDFSNKEIISQYHAKTIFPVYETSVFYSRNWEPPSFEYDFNKSFFEQFNVLLRETPRAALLTDLQSLQQNSQYQNSSSRNKNCYLVFAAGDNENCMYGANVDYCKDCVDNLFIRNSELCYQCTDCLKSYHLFFSQDCQNCSDSYFLFDCRNVSDSFGCVGLRNKSYCFFNKQLSKDEYQKAIIEVMAELEGARKKFLELVRSYPHKFSRIEYSGNCKGDFIFNSKNIHRGFMIYDCEDCKYCFKLVKCRDCYDYTDWGDPAQFCYECNTVGKNAHNVKFSNNCWPGCYNIQYCDSCSSSHDLFGCIGLKYKSHCLLNKQYSKEEYERLVPKIIEQMNKMPYVSKITNHKAQITNKSQNINPKTQTKEIIYRYGEFFPSELSPFAYNETIAQEYFPLTKEQAINQGYSWRDPEERNYQITMKTELIPDHIKDVSDSVLEQVIECANYKPEKFENSNIENSLKIENWKLKINSDSEFSNCTTAFKIIPQELQFYRRMNLPLPRLCPNCRHYQRIKQRNPLKLWHRQCMCAGKSSTNGLRPTTNDLQLTTNNVYQNTAQHFHQDKPCPNEFETSYSSERQEIVYCEKCYLAEVV